jgi:hypothetical protein
MNDRLSPIAQSIDEQRESWRWLAPVGIIEVISGQRLTPFWQHLDQSPRAYVLLHDHLGPIAQAQPCNGHFGDHVNGVEHQLPFCADLHLMPIFRKSPDIQPARCRQAQVDAAMPDQILRGARRPMLIKIRWRADQSHRHIRPDPHRNHVLGDLFVKADARVVTLADNVGQAVIVDDLDVEIGVLGQQGLEHRPEIGLCGMFDRADPDRACGLFPQRAQGRDAGIKVLKRGLQCLQQALAGVGRGNAAGGAGQQPQTQPGFKSADDLAERGLGNPQFCRRAGKAPLLGHHDKGGQIGHFLTPHP